MNLGRDDVILIIGHLGLFHCILDLHFLSRGLRGRCICVVFPFISDFFLALTRRFFWCSSCSRVLDRLLPFVRPRLDGLFNICLCHLVKTNNSFISVHPLRSEVYFMLIGGKHQLHGIELCYLRSDPGPIIDRLFQ